MNPRVRALFTLLADAARRAARGQTSDRYPGASIGLVLLSPVLLLVAALVELDSRGPMLFQQERVGPAGRRFQIIRFRTMVLVAEAWRNERLERSIYADPRLFKLVQDYIQGWTLTRDLAILLQTVPAVLRMRGAHRSPTRVAPATRSAMVR